MILAHGEGETAQQSRSWPGPCANIFDDCKSLKMKPDKNDFFEGRALMMHG
jgi:hypothetical protein